MNLASTTKRIMRSLHNDDQVSKETMNSVYALICLVFGNPAGNKFHWFFDSNEFDEYKRMRNRVEEFDEWMNSLK